MSIVGLTAIISSFLAILTPFDLDGEMKRVEALEALHEIEVKKSNPRSAAELLEPQFENLARELSGTESGLRAELWVLRNHWWKRTEGTMEAASNTQANRLIKEYPNSPQLIQIAEFGYLYGRKNVIPLMDSLIKVSPHANVDAWAIHAKVSMLRRSKDDGAALELQKNLELLRDRYGEVAFRDTTFGVLAKAMLSPHQKTDLEVGKVAPEIEGADVDGNQFRLSDFRGKVVLLDFWGDW